ncbi:MAG TPA: decaprenyl-phosphate phosphoribosyltransferase [Solirubrobacteraceae bacterium]|nr:decaprenyl-phosphate phosphoribosyltransferase [Solirubrobacteraceae bacterium]
MSLAPLVRACRPRQWLKNAVVALGPAAGGELGEPGVAGRLLVTGIAFCLLSSATYLVNDVRDRHQDRLHPRKRHRPIAAGLIAPGVAVRIAVALAATGLLLGASVGGAVSLTGLSYLLLTSSYSLLWRRIVVADLLAVSLGFGLRAVAGADAAGQSLPGALFAVAVALALFLVAGKRHAELLARGARGATRATLGRYSKRLLRAMLVVSAIAALAAYCRWAFSESGLNPLAELSAIPFMLCLVRYATLLRAGAGEAPDELVVADRTLLVFGAAWACLMMGGLYGGP